MSDSSSTEARFRLSRYFLLAFFAFQVAFGYLVAFGYGSRLLHAHRRRMARVFLDREAVPEAVLPLVEQFAAMLGSTISCWAVAMCWVVAIPFRERKRWAWWCVATSLVAWTLVDTGLSIAHGAGFNALFNVFPTVAVGVPLALTFDEFRPEEPRRDAD